MSATKPQSPVNKRTANNTARATSPKLAWAADFRSISIRRDYTMYTLHGNVLRSKLLTMSLFFPMAWLAIGLAWAYRSITRKEYAGLVIAGGFCCWRFFRLCGSDHGTGDLW